MKQFIRSVLLLVAGLLLVGWGLVVPVHLRALDAKVVANAKTAAFTLVEEGATLLSLEKVGPARMLVQVARQENAGDWEQLETRIVEMERSNPEFAVWGGSDPYLDQVFTRDYARQIQPGPLLGQFMPRTHRQALYNFLRFSRRSGVRDVLATRDLKETAFFPEVSSASGQPLETVILTVALLFQGDHITPQLRDHILELARQANAGETSAPLERIYLDVLSLASRFNWAQLADFIRHIDSPRVLNDLANLVRVHDDQAAIIYSAVHLSSSPGAVARYLIHFSETGLQDLSYSLRSGKGGARALLQHQQRIFYPEDRLQATAIAPVAWAAGFFSGVARYAPRIALALKYLFIFAGGFLLARAFRPVFRSREPLVTPDIDTRLSLIRSGVFAVAFLFTTIVLAEPFLAIQEHPREFPFQWQFALAPEALVGQIQNSLNFMNDYLSLIAVAAFFLLQLIIYAVCLVKLAEIRRQSLPSDLKLRLLENEENMFDLGLYCGLGGTVISLIFLAMKIVQPSLMAAYSSTLFGIIFVAILKVFHLRPLRRKLILQSHEHSSSPLSA